MSRTPRYHELIETSWRRKLSPAEESELRALTAVDAEMRADWDAEAALNQGLSTLPEVPVPSNFTARVMQAINAEEARDRRQRQPILSRWAPWRRLVRKAAFVSVVLAAGLLSYHKVNEDRRARLAESVAAVSGIVSLPSPQILQDFDAIHALTPTPRADEELLVLMQ